MLKDEFADAVSAFEQVKKTVAAFKAEHIKICSEIEAVETELSALPLACVPIEDMKEAVLDLLEVSSSNYAKEKIRKSIISFVTGKEFDVLTPENIEKRGKPLSYLDIEKSMDGTDPKMSRAQLLTGGVFDDRVLYAFFSQAIRDGLREIMEGMKPDELGYGAIHPSKIGTSRVERRQAIDDCNNRLSNLKERKSVIEMRLASIGAQQITSPGKKS